MRITFPLNSPDLNPIENIWRRIKKKSTVVDISHEEKFKNYRKQF
jgi:transposase